MLHVKIFELRFKIHVNVVRMKRFDRLSCVKLPTFLSNGDSIRVIKLRVILRCN
jgi:hypothetical protein